jgi:RNA recognition motif-containing protein
VVPEAAQALMNASQAGQPMLVGEQPVKINWAKATPLHHTIAQAVADGATRNLYVGGLPEDATEEDVGAAFATYCQGQFDSIRIMREKVTLLTLLTLLTRLTNLKAYQCC